MILPAFFDCSAGGTIASIEVSGRSEVAEEVVDRALGLSPGATLSAPDFVRLEEALMATGRFASVAVLMADGSRGCVLQVRLVELPRVKEVRFEGATLYRGGQELLPDLSSRPGNPANRSTAEDDARKIADRYHRDGYEAATVECEVAEDGVVTFRIAEGRIARVEVVGAQTTGPRRVLQVLGVQPGDLYDSAVLAAGQGVLYRTGLFGSVGFGVEPAGNGDLVLTVTVSELTRPYQRTEIFADRGGSWAGGDVRLRNVGGGNALHLHLDLVGNAPGDLASTGFDNYYAGHLLAELALFHPDPAAAAARFGFDADRVRGRMRPELGLHFDLDLPAALAAAEIPVLSGKGYDGRGLFQGQAGWRQLVAYPLAGGPGAAQTDPFGRGEIGFTLTRVAGLEAPAHLQVLAGVEMNGGEHTFTSLSAEGEIRQPLPGWHHRVEMEGDSGTLSGEVPFWREFVLGGPGGPLGYPRELAFARSYARARAGYAADLVPAYAGAEVGWAGASWSGATGTSGTQGAQSVYGLLFAGPDFARLTVGLAAPLPGATLQEPWFFLDLVIATPR